MPSSKRQKRAPRTEVSPSISKLADETENSSAQTEPILQTGNAKSNSKEDSASSTISNEEEDIYDEDKIVVREAVDSLSEIPPLLCAPCIQLPSDPKKRKLTDEEIFSKPNRHVWNGYCPCCD